MFLRTCASCEDRFIISIKVLDFPFFVSEISSSILFSKVLIIATAIPFVVFKPFVDIFDIPAIYKGAIKLASGITVVCFGKLTAVGTFGVSQGVLPGSMTNSDLPPSPTIAGPPGWSETPCLYAGKGSGIYARHATMLLHDVPEGKYLVQLQKVGLFTDFDYFIVSEPIHVKAYHENTILIKYSHSKNAYGIFWETGIEMWIRVHASLTKLQPDSKFNMYDDDEYNATLLSGVKYRTWQLTFGVGNNPVPAYLLDKFEEILLCDKLDIENILYTRPENSSMELSPVEKSPLLTANTNFGE